MIDPKKQADTDQAISSISEILPTLWATMFRRLLQQGFTEAQAFDLLKTYVSASCKNNS